VSYESIARRYARAIFELGKETRGLAEIAGAVQDFAAAYTSSTELQAVLENPLVRENEREGVLRDIAAKLGASGMGLNALLLLLRKRRMGAIPEIARQLGRLVDEDAGLLRAEVTSAGPLGEPYLAKLRAELEKATGKKVKIEHRQDASLIGGVVTKIGDRVVDGSLKARLSSFRDALLST
jgi:F-type H+-transporting ATPase subunit delta